MQGRCQDFKILKSRGNFAKGSEPFVRQNLTIIASLLLNFKILRQALEFKIPKPFLICGALLSICVSKHQLYAVFLIYRACARVVVDSGDVCLRVVLFNLSDHSARDDVVW